MESNLPILTRRGAQLAKIQTRAMTKSSSSNGLNDNRKPNAQLLEVKRRAKFLKMQNTSNPNGDQVVKDIYQNAVDAKEMVQKPTGLIYDESMISHRCLWDKNHPEKPERFIQILNRCKELNLLDRCQQIPSRPATKDEILKMHTEEHYQKLEETSKGKNADELEEMCSKFDSIFIHPSTFELSLLATGCTIDLVRRIVAGDVQNGMAIIRPPGHHAMKAEFNGYCFFNNVAIAAQHALEMLSLQRIMIIDWDVHHGQGTQRFFYNDPRVLYFSIHRYEHGTFWPNLKESNFDYIGHGAGLGYNFNVPLNIIGAGNGDYMAIFQQILIPVAVEYQPELIIISAGYDAALGCPEGEMEVTPEFFPHLINPLLKLAQSKVAVILEGGYCLESLSEGAALTLRALLGEPCPMLVEKLQPPRLVVQDSIFNCISMQRRFWKCLQVQSLYSEEEFNNVTPQSNLHKVNRLYVGTLPLPERFPTRGTAPLQMPEDIKKNQQRLSLLKKETKLISPKERTCFVYDERMLLHKNTFDDGHPEQPDRIRKIYEMHQEYELLPRLLSIPARVATTDEICLAHTRAHVNSIRRITEKDGLQDLSGKYNSVYFHPNTFECATVAAGSVLQVVDKVLSGEVRNGVCFVRPPGHHAEPDVPFGFCIFNNIAIAAQYAIRDHGLKRVLIVDWDVHHGNGTQHIFESNPCVLYISVHRYDNATFFPKSVDGNFDVVGKGVGEGFNVNIPWNKKGMGDLEYVMAFQQLIMPIAYEYDPELVLISAGFDASIGDPLGGCKVTPEAYGLFTHWLSGLANGRVIVCLEGGYNINSISYAMTMCTKSLLGDPIPSIQINNNVLDPSVTYTSCIETIQNCQLIQSRYWKCLEHLNKRLPEFLTENNNENFLSETMQFLTLCTNEIEDPIGDAFLRGEFEFSKPSCSKPKVKVKTISEFLKENIEAMANNEMFAVIPSSNCKHLRELNSEEAPQSINTNAQCLKCSSTVENWMCLTCHSVLCGRYVHQHMLEHFKEFNHPLALSFCDLSVWCYACESYVDNRKLYKYKNLAHLHKFSYNMCSPYAHCNDSDDSGEELP